MTGYDVRKKLEVALRARAAQAGTDHPLSYAQRPLLLLHRMNPRSASYNVGFTARFTGGFVPAAFHDAVRSLVGRHAALRTTFGRPVAEATQTVHGWLEPDLSEVDARSWGREQLDDAVRAAYREPFDLGTGPLVRARVFTVADGAALVLLTLHHVVCDFWSLSVVLAELEQLYAAEVERRPAELAGHNAPYSDFVSYQRGLVDGEKGRRALAHWREQLAGDLPPVTWPRCDLDQDVDGGGSVVFPIPDEVTAGVLALARDEGVTTYAVLLTVFQVLLSRYSGRQDVVAGSPFAGRTDPSLAGCVGNFVNPVALRADLSDAAPFREQLARTRRTVVAALEHQDFPFELLVSELAPRRTDDRNPIFQAMFSYQKPSRFPALAGLYVADEGAAAVPWAGLTAQPYRLDQQDDQLELVLEVVHDGDRLVGLLKHRRSVFSRAAARAVVENYLSLLRAALADPETSVAALPLATAVEPATPAPVREAVAVSGVATGAHERRVTAAWQQVLGRSDIGPDDNFFDLGGNSMLLMQVHELLAGAADTPLTVPDLFRHPTPASLARRLGAQPVSTGAGRERASSRRAQLADGSARSARLRARNRADSDGGRNG